MSKSKIMKVFHQHNKDYLHSCGFMKVNDVYVKFSEKKDCLIKIDLLVLSTTKGIFSLEPMISFVYLYDEFSSIDFMFKADSRFVLVAGNINGFLPKYLKDNDSSVMRKTHPLDHQNVNVNNIHLNSGKAYLSSTFTIVDIYMRALSQIFQKELNSYFYCRDYTQAMEIIRDMHSRSLHRIQSRWLQERYHREDSLWRYHIMHGNFQVAKDGYLHLKNTNLRSCEESLKHAIKELDAINNNESSWQSVNLAKLNELNMKLLTIQYKDSIDRLSKRIEELTHEKEKWLSIMSTCPLKERDRLILVYERNLREVEKIFNNDVTHVKEIQKIMPRSIPLLDNLERIVIRRGAENWKQIQTHIDEFFKAKGYHRKSDREMWERTWCIVETQDFWIIMELDESGITNEHLRDYDQLSKHLTKVLVTSGFFLYSFEFSESLARLYSQGECVDHWVIDEGLEVDEQEICQPLAWESSKIANPYRMKDPEEVHLIDILYDWMEMLKINPQWMVEEVDSTQNFKKCHIFGYAIAQNSDV